MPLAVPTYSLYWFRRLAHFLRHAPGIGVIITLLVRVFSGPRGGGAFVNGRADSTGRLPEPQARSPEPVMVPVISRRQPVIADHPPSDLARVGFDNAADQHANPSTGSQRPRIPFVAAPSPPPVDRHPQPVCEPQARSPEPVVVDSQLTTHHSSLSLPTGLENGFAPLRDHGPIYDSSGEPVPPELLDEYGRLKRPKPKPRKRYKRGQGPGGPGGGWNRGMKWTIKPDRNRLIYPELIWREKNGYRSAHAGFVRYDHSKRRQAQDLTANEQPRSVSPVPTIDRKDPKCHVTRKTRSIPDSKSDSLLTVPVPTPVNGSLISGSPDDLGVCLIFAYYFTYPVLAADDRTSNAHSCYCLGETSMLRTTSARHLLIVILTLPLTLFAQNLPTDTSSLFAGSGVCANCHSSDGSIMMENNKDISPPTTWRSSMMANAAKDPVWQAKVMAENQDNPALQAIIEDKCTTCHAPLGRTQAIYDGADGYTFDEAMGSALALDGVSCTLCHQIQADNLGTEASYSGGYEIGDEHVIYGPYQNIFPNPMINQSGFTPTYGEHIRDSELCGTCHTLFTPYVDNNGNIAGEFPEQTPYLEWENSDYPGEGIECQTCHVPETTTPQDISTMPPWHTETHTPFGKHELAGANMTMLGLIQDNLSELGITATDAQFDETLGHTSAMLQRAASLHGSYELIGDTLVVDVEVRSRTGHKLPTGIPLRRMWLHVTARDEAGNVLFESGEWDGEGRIPDEDTPYEVHRNRIDAEDEVQIYEGVMGDVDNERTWTLLRAGQYLKDNRIPPRGFDIDHENYDDTGIFGRARFDRNFNRATGPQTTGVDIVQYRMPAAATVEIELVMQTLNPRFIDDLLTHTGDKVDQFAGMYAEAGNEPYQLAEIEISLSPTHRSTDSSEPPMRARNLRVYPNPANASSILGYELPYAQQVTLQLYTVNGRLVQTIHQGAQRAGEHAVSLNINGLSSGIYLARMSGQTWQAAERFVVLK